MPQIFVRMPGIDGEPVTWLPAGLSLSSTGFTCVSQEAMEGKEE